MKKAVLAGFILLSSFCHGFSHDTQLWLGTYFQGPADGDFEFYLEVQPRIGADISRLHHILVRPAIVYKTSPNLSLWAGYGWTPTFDSGFRDEQRLWQQALYRDKAGVYGWFIRLRLEERMIEGSELAWRTRVMGRLSGPLGSSASLEWLIWDELFLNLNSPLGGPISGYDRNRLFAGVVWRFHSLMALEVGYMNQIIKATASTLMTHNACLFVFVNY